MLIIILLVQNLFGQKNICHSDRIINHAVHYNYNKVTLSWGFFAHKIVHEQ